MKIKIIILFLIAFLSSCGITPLGPGEAKLTIKNSTGVAIFGVHWNDMYFYNQQSWFYSVLENGASATRIVNAGSNNIFFWTPYDTNLQFEVIGVEVLEGEHYYKTIKWSESCPMTN